MNIKYIRTTDKKKYDLRDKRITDTDTGVATQSANGLLSSTDKKKLDGIASGAEVNQNAFSNIKIGNTTIAADGKTDTVELTAGNNITLTPDATNDKITIAATDTNTTYTFAGGTNKFTVTPSNGTAQTVSVTPSIANNVTGSDLTANTIILGNGNSGVKKSGKTIVTTLGSDDTTLPTSKAVKAAIDALPEPMIFKGTLGTGGTITSLPAAASGNNGFTYKVITAGTYASQSAKIGDVFISNGSSWNLIPSGDEPGGTVTNIATGTGLTGGPITSSGTISHADTSSQASVSNSGRTYIQSITLDSMGHVTGIASATETVTNTDTHVTQRLNADNGNYPILSSAVSIVDTTRDVTAIVLRNNSIYTNPSTGTITANKFNGSSTHAETSSQSGFVENHGENLEHYWVKLWEMDVTRTGDDLDVTFLLQSAFQKKQGILHLGIRNDYMGGGVRRLSVSMRLTSGNIDTNRIRLYYNDSTSNCQLWYNCGSRQGCINAKILHKTWRQGKEVPTFGTMYSTSTNVLQTLPGTGYAYVEPIYAVISEWNDVQNKPSSYPNATSASKLTTDAGSATQPVYFKQGVPTACSYQLNKTVPSNAVFTDTTYSSKSEASGGTDVSLVTTGEKYTWNHKSNLALGNTSSTALAGNTKYAGSSTQGGAATSAEKLTNTSNIGNTNQPVYFTTSGVPAAISYTINKSVPSNAVFTDTHYTTHLYAGSGTAANAATTNGNTKLTVVDNTTTRNSVTIKGTGGTTVTSDKNGVVTINSTDISCKQFTFLQPTRSDDGYYFIISPKGNATVTPGGTCYFVEITALINNGPDSFVTRSAKFMTHCHWFSQNSGLRITDPVYKSGAMSACPILYHSHAVGTDVGTETYNYNVCNIPFRLSIETGLMSVNIKVEGPDVSECTCSRSYTSFKWPAVEPDWGAV